MVNKSKIVIGLLLAMGNTFHINAQKSTPIDLYEGYQLVWEESFIGNGLPDSTFWGYESGYKRNNELQDYKAGDKQYAWQENGRLVLKAVKDQHKGINPWNKKAYTFEYSSASINTHHKKTFKYGRIDVSARIPIGRGIWPAIWLMPENSEYGDWPKSGEIDVMEYVWGNGDNHFQIYSTIHTEDIDVNGNKIDSGVASSATLDSDFHLYSLLWTEEYIEILFDNQTIFTFSKSDNSYEKWPFNKEFYLMMNIAVGGSWGGQWGIDENIFPAVMEVDYVRYYQKNR